MDSHYVDNNARNADIHPEWPCNTSDFLMFVEFFTPCTKYSDRHQWDDHNCTNDMDDKNSEIDGSNHAFAAKLCKARV